jgi:16S rRNA (cytidine1402-2'-O)-methyltransferase
MAGGTLFLVATPIGNLEDITLRAVRILKEVSLIAAEDTRRTKTLLVRHEVRTPMASYQAYSEERKLEPLLARLQRGEDIALVTDGGTPGISDPGGVLIRAAIEHGIPVVPIPGPTAFVAALVASGLPCDRFTFAGFLPVKPGRRANKLAALAGEEATLIFYESPFRLEKSLRDLLAVLGDRRAAVARELTKMHEEIKRGKLSELMVWAGERKPKGEMVIVVEGRGVLRGD